MNILFTIGAWTTFIAFGVGIFCLSQLHSHIDEERIRREPSIGDALKQSPLPSRVLTEKGKRLRLLGFSSFVFALVLFLGMFIGRLLFP